MFKNTKKLMNNLEHSLPANFNWTVKYKIQKLHYNCIIAIKCRKWAIKILQTFFFRFSKF